MNFSSLLAIGEKQGKAEQVASALFRQVPEGIKRRQVVNIPALGFSILGITCIREDLFLLLAIKRRGKEGRQIPTHVYFPTLKVFRRGDRIWGDYDPGGIMPLFVEPRELWKVRYYDLGDFVFVFPFEDERQLHPLAPVYRLNRGGGWAAQPMRSVNPRFLRRFLFAKINLPQNKIFVLNGLGEKVDEFHFPLNLLSSLPEAKPLICDFSLKGKKFWLLLGLPSPSPPVFSKVWFLQFEGEKVKSHELKAPSILKTSELTISSPSISFHNPSIVAWWAVETKGEITIQRLFVLVGSFIILIDFYLIWERSNEKREVWTVNEEGNLCRLLWQMKTKFPDFFAPLTALSADGRIIAYTKGENLWVAEVPGLCRTKPYR